jgi:hypothetical protein
VRGCGGGFGSGILTTGSSSGGNGCGGDVLEHQVANRAEGGRQGSKETDKGGVWQTSTREGRSSGDGLNSWWGSDGDGGRSGQEARGVSVLLEEGCRRGRE